ncbi:MAG: hypothetical protein R6X19_06290 [Kiritimatiellia bacterium]
MNYRRAAILILSGLLSTCFAGESKGKNRIEEYGANPFFHAYYGTLAVTPLPDGTSRIIRSGGAPFSGEFKGKTFVAFRIHRNPTAYPPNFDYYPCILGCRYSTVTDVVDDRTLVVDFAYNGGNRDSPKATAGASGEFFFDNRSVFKAVLENPERPSEILLQGGKTYVSRGSWQANLDLRHRPLLLRGDTPENRAVIKVSAEDAFAIDIGGGGSRLPQGQAFAIPSGALLNLSQGDQDCVLRDIDIVGPIYTPPRVQEGFNYALYHYAGGPCARTVSLENCDTQRQRKEIEKTGITLPEGANFVGPDFGYFAGGGKHDGKDITGEQILKIDNCVIHASSIITVKNQDGGGNTLVFQGKDAQNRTELIEIIKGLKLGDANPTETEVAFGVDDTLYKDIVANREDPYGARLITITDPRHSWYMFANQYWTGGVSTDITEPIQVDVDGLYFRLGNSADWWALVGYKDSREGQPQIKSSAEARMFNRIPRAGETVRSMPAPDGVTSKHAAYDKEKGIVEKGPGSLFYAWDWMPQVGDVYAAGGETYTVTGIERKGGGGPSLHYWLVSTQGLWHGYGTSKGEGVLHVTLFSLDRPVPARAKEMTFTVVTSKAEYLLDGKPRKAKIAYARDYNGHCMYNRQWVGHDFKHVTFQGYFRTTYGFYQGGAEDLWNLPLRRRWVDVIHRGGGQHQGSCMKLRYALTGKAEDRYSIIDGGRLSVDNFDAPGEFAFRNRPILSGDCRLADPVMLDDRGLAYRLWQPQDWGRLRVYVTRGQTVNLSGLESDVDVSLSGSGSVLIDRLKAPTLRFEEKAEGTGSLAVRGKNGVADIMIGRETNLDRTSVELRNWQGKINAPETIKTHPAFAEKIVVKKGN